MKLMNALHALSRKEVKAFFADESNFSGEASVKNILESLEVTDTSDLMAFNKIEFINTSLFSIDGDILNAKADIQIMQGMLNIGNGIKVVVLVRYPIVDVSQSITTFIPTRKILQAYQQNEDLSIIFSPEDDSILFYRGSTWVEKNSITPTTVLELANLNYKYGKTVVYQNGINGAVFACPYDDFLCRFKFHFSMALPAGFPMSVDTFVAHGTDAVWKDATVEPYESYARWVLNHYLLSGVLVSEFEQFMAPYRLFCMYKGKEYRVTGASTLGDVWLSSNIQANSGYDKRANIEECSNWNKLPKAERDAELAHPITATISIAVEFKGVNFVHYHEDIYMQFDPIRIEESDVNSELIVKAANEFLKGEMFAGEAFVNDGFDQVSIHGVTIDSAKSYCKKHDFPFSDES